jgi:hypothetical protein
MSRKFSLAASAFLIGLALAVTPLAAPFAPRAEAAVEKAAEKQTTKSKSAAAAKKHKAVAAKSKKPSMGKSKEMLATSASTNRSVERSQKKTH